jgi:hypothetical protein
MELNFLCEKCTRAHGPTIIALGKSAVSVLKVYFKH